MYQRLLNSIKNNNTIVIFSFSWLTVLSCAFFWMYGIFGFFTVPRFGIYVHGFVTILLTCSFLVILILNKKKGDLFKDSVTIKSRDVCVFLLFFVIMGSMSLTELRAPISSDNFYHAQQSQVYGIHIVQILGDHFHSLESFSFLSLLGGTNILIVTFIIGLFFILKRLSFAKRAVFLAALFILLRTAMYFGGGNASPFPTLRLFPLFLTSIFFGLSDTALRCASFFVLIACIFFIYKASVRYMGAAASFLLALSIGTIPVLWHTGMLVEFSIWTAFLFTFVLFFFREKESSIVPYMRATMFVAVSTLMRVSGFIALIPIFVHYCVSKKRTKEEFWTYGIMSFPALLTVAPLIIGNTITGSAATYHGEAYLNLGILEGSSLIERLEALLQGPIISILYNSFHFLALLLFLLPFFIFRKKVTAYPALILIISSFLLFFSVSPFLWGNGRYQAEYLVPCLALLLFYCSKFLRKEFLVFSFLMAVIVYNVYEFKHIPKYNSSWISRGDYFYSTKEKGEYFVLSETPYPYYQVLREVKSRGHATSTYYFSGNGYSYVAKIMSGYSVGEMKYDEMFRKTIGYDSSERTVSNMLNSSDIKILVRNYFGTSQEKDILSRRLMSYGYIETDIRKDPLYGFTIVTYKKQ